jgi:hypothetical protein
MWALPPLPPAKEVWDALLHAVLPAFLTATVVAAIVRLVGGKRLSILAGAAAMAVGCGVGSYTPGVFPLEFDTPPSSKWLLWVALAALVDGVLARVVGTPFIVRWRLRVIGAVAAALLLTPAELRLIRWFMPAFAAVIVAEWAVVEELCRRQPGGWTPLCLSVAFLGAAPVELYTHIASFTDMASIFAAAAGGVALVAWLLRMDAGGIAGGAAVLLPGLLLAGKAESYSDVPWDSFVLAALAPLALTLALLPPVARLPRVAGRLVQLLLVIVPIVVAVARAMQYETLDFGGG